MILTSYFQSYLHCFCSMESFGLYINKILGRKMQHCKTFFSILAL